MKKKAIACTAILCIAALVFALCGCGQEESEEDAQGVTYIDSVDKSSPYATGLHHATISVQGYEDFTVELDADMAPITVVNFCNLANDGFYNGLTFHRMISDFCLQGGDPLGNGTGGSTDYILGEYSANQVKNSLADDFKRGVVAMARGAYDYNSASSQFFITLSDTAATSLNGSYAAFGTIDEAGMLIVDQIVLDYVGYTDSQNGVISDTSLQPVISKITIVD